MSVQKEFDAADKEVMADIEKAATFLDEYFDKGEWPPSSKLKVIWFMAATQLEIDLMGASVARLNSSIKRVNSAIETIDQLLSEARQRWLDGFYANPFGEPVMKPGMEPTDERVNEEVVA